MPAARHFPNWLDVFVEYGGYGEAPRDAIFWTGVSCISAVLRRNVWFDMGYWSWFPNHYIVLVARPGIIGKGVTLSIGQNLLDEVPGLHIAPDSITWQSLVTTLAETREDVNFVDPATGEIEYIPTCCLTVLSSEFGTLIDMRNTDMVNMLIKMYDAEKKLEKKTKTSGDDIAPRPWLNMMACTTPAWIATGFDELTIQGGFTSRCLFVFADEKRVLVAYPKRHMPPDLSVTKARLIEDLCNMSTLRGDFIMTEDAYEFGEEIYKRHWNGAAKGTDTAHLGGYWARKQAHLHKLAMVLSAAESNKLQITRKHLETANNWVSQTEQNLTRVFELVGRSADSRLANEIIAFVSRLGMVTRADLHAHFISHYGEEEVNRGVNTCFAANKLASRDMGGTAYLMIPKPVTAPQPQVAAPAQTPAQTAAPAPSLSREVILSFAEPGETA